MDYKSQHSGPAIDKAVADIQSVDLQKLNHYLGIFSDLGTRPVRGKQAGDYCYVGVSTDCDEHHWNGHVWTIAQTHLNLVGEVNNIVQELGDNPRVAISQMAISQIIRDIVSMDDEQTRNIAGNANAIAELQKVAEALNTLTAEHSNTISEHSNTLANHQQELDDHSQVLEDHQAQLVNHAESISSLNDDIDRIDNTDKEQQAQIGSNTTRITAVENRSSALEQQTTELNARTSELENKSLRYKGVFADASLLPTDAMAGDYAYVGTDTTALAVYTFGAAWAATGEIVDLATVSNLDNIMPAEPSEHRAPTTALLASELATQKAEQDAKLTELESQLGAKIYDADLAFAGIENKTINLGVSPDDQVVFQMSSSARINVKVSEILPGSVVNTLATIEDSNYHIVTISTTAASSLIFTKTNSGEQTIHIKVFKNNPNVSIKGLITKDSEQVAEINNTKGFVNARTNGFLNQPTYASAKKVLEIVSNVFFFNENNLGGIHHWKTLMTPSSTLAYFMVWDGTNTFTFQIDGERSGKTTYNLTANDHPEVHCQFTVDWSIGFISPLQDTTLNLAIVSSPYGEYLKEYVDGQKFEKVNPRSVFTHYQAQVLSDLNDALPNTKYILTIDATHQPANLPTDYPVNPADNALLETITTVAYPGLQVKYQTIRSYQLGGYHYYRTYTSNYGWAAWSIVSDLPIYEIGPGRKYTTLRAGIEAATKVRNADVYIYAGTYDLTQEFATELADSSYNQSFGIFLKNGVRLHFLAGSYVKAIVDMSGGDDVRILNWFSPFEIHGDFEIDGLNIEVQNTRYCVHDDTDGNEVLGAYRNCVMVNHTTSSSQYAHGQCIGGGIVLHKYITINNCVFRASKAGDANIPAVFYHNGAGIIDDSKIFVKDCRFADNNRLGVYSYGQSQLLSYMYACGNSLSNAEDIFAEKLNPEQPYDNMDVIAWNNEFRDNL